MNGIQMQNNDFDPVDPFLMEKKTFPKKGFPAKGCSLERLLQNSISERKKTLHTSIYFKFYVGLRIARGNRILSG